MNNAGDLLGIFRDHVDDAQREDSFWSDAEFYEYLTDATEKFALETKCIIDGVTTQYVNLSVTASNPWVTPNERVIYFEKATLASTGKRLALINWRDLEEGYLGVNDYSSILTGSPTTWETTTGTPAAMITDMDSTRYRLYPIPVTSDTITGVVRRLPTSEITQSSHTPEIPLKFWRSLLPFCYYRAYNKQDADSFDPTAAARYLAEWRAVVVEAKRFFERRYGKLPRTVRSSW